MSRQRPARRKTPVPAGTKRAGAALAERWSPNDHGETGADGRRWEALLDKTWPALLIALIAFVAYANAWPNNLVLDDKLFENPQRFAQLSDIPGYFAENAWASQGFQSSFYRPLLLTSITMDARVYGDWVAGFHLTNIILHVLVSLLVYGFLLQLLRATNRQESAAPLWALLAAAVFAVHPVHTEVVASIFNRSEAMVALAGLAGLMWWLRHWRSRPWRAWVGLALAYLVALFCKETAVVLPGLAVIIAFLLTPGSLWPRVRACLPAFALGVPLALYLAVRSQVLQSVEGGSIEPPVLTALGDVGDTLEALAAQNWDRSLDVVGSWYQALKVLIWPFPLRLSYPALSSVEQYFGLAVHLFLVVTALLQARKKHYGLVLGLAFFYLTLLPSSRLIGEASIRPQFYERYVYFASVGLSIALAFGLRAIAGRYNARFASGAVMAALIVLTPVTWARNANWADDVTLFEADYANGVRTWFVLRLLTAAYLEDRDFEKVEAICDRHTTERDQSAALSVHCGEAYRRLGREEEAIQAYLRATKDRYTAIVAHDGLARLYISQRNRPEATKHLEAAVRAEPNKAMRAFRQGFMLAQLYPRNQARLLEARAYFARALQLQPNLQEAHQWLARVEEQLGSL